MKHWHCWIGFAATDYDGAEPVSVRQITQRLAPRSLYRELAERAIWLNFAVPLEHPLQEEFSLV